MRIVLLNTQMLLPPALAGVIILVDGKALGGQPGVSARKFLEKPEQ